MANRNKLPFTLHQLVLIQTVASIGNFKHAAKKLNMTQSALSLQIQNLERGLNSSLFYRKRMRSKLTYNGQIFLRYVFRILALCNEGESAIFTSSLKKKKLVIASTPTIGIYIIPQVVRNFQMYRPELIIKKGIDRTEKISWDVARHHIDVGFSSGIIPSSLHSLLNIKPYVKEEIVLISLFPLFINSKNAEIKNLYRLNFIGFYSNTSAQKSINECLVRRGIRIRKMQFKIKLGSTEAIKNAVKENLGVSFISMKSVKRESELRFLIVFRLKNKRIFRTLWIISHLNGISSDLIEILEMKAETTFPTPDYNKIFIDKIVY